MKNKDVELFQNANVGELIYLRKKVLIVRETTENYTCDTCVFRQISMQCPHFIDIERPTKPKPVCFSTERPDKKSVYFEEKKQIWENKKKKAIL